MSELKRRIRTAIMAARKHRTSPVGSRRLAALHLTRAGELRRSAFYIYGPGSR